MNGIEPAVTLPTKALSVRQPWAWAIIYGGKDIENRTAVSVRKGTMEPKEICIHASKGMTPTHFICNVRTWHDFSSL